VLANAPPYTEAISVLVQRLAYDSLDLIAAQTFPAADSSARAATLVASARAAWPREEFGPFVVFRDNSPAPGDQGGTCISLPGPDWCLYLARTKWQGPHDVLAPA
jgi:hypothetical protein